MTNIKKVVHFIDGDYVVSIVIDWDEHNQEYLLCLKVSDEDRFPQIKIQILFKGVVEMNLINFGGGLFQFCDLIIEIDDRGYDRRKYIVRQIEDDSIIFGCRSYELLSA